MKKICKVEGCGRKIKAKELCAKHYHRLQRHGCVAERTRYDSNEIIVEGNMAYIQLYNQLCNPIEKAIIDKEDVAQCKKYKWHLNGYGYVNTRIKMVNLLLHNFVLNRKASRKIQVDHKNQIKHDCRKSNLRLCTPNENKYNVGLISTNTSGFKGVHFCRQTKKWVAQIIANDKYYSLGYFTDIEEAARVRDRAAIKLHGNFAVLNFPNEV